MKISVAITTYNGAAFLAEQLDSIATQTRLPDELVVCDDCSSDSSVELVHEFARDSAFPVHLVVNESNIGSTRNFEQAIKRCTGDIIALSDQDDVWLPRKLQRFESHFSSAPGTGIVFSNAEIVDEHLQSRGQNLWDLLEFGPREREQIKSGHALDVLLPGWFVTGATMAFRSRFRDLVLEIPDDLEMIHDGWLALILAAVSDVGLIEEPLIKYRQHPRQQVGAPKHVPRQPAGFAGVVEAMRRDNPFEGLIKIAESARHRLISSGAKNSDDPAILMLDSRLKHLRMRSSLASSRVERTAAVLKELFTLRYHRYSKGTRSAIKDLVS